MTDKEIEIEVRKAIAKGSQKLTDYLYRKWHFDFRRLNAIVQEECGSAEPIKDEKRLLPEHLKPFRISHPRIPYTTAHFWARRYCFFTGRDGQTYRAMETLIGGGYYDLPPDGRGLIVEVSSDNGCVILNCMRRFRQPLTYEESEALLIEIERELGIQEDSDEVKALDLQYNLSDTEPDSNDNTERI